jgi:hypothetical protein
MHPFVKMLANSLKMPIFVPISGDFFYYSFYVVNSHKISNLFLIITSFFHPFFADFYLFMGVGNLNYMIRLRILSMNNQWHKAIDITDFHV